MKGRKTGGRKKGTPNVATVEARAVCAAIVNDPAYVAKLKVRAKSGKLAPAVETMLWQYAHGKPRDVPVDDLPVAFTLNIGDRPAEPSAVDSDDSCPAA